MMGLPSDSDWHPPGASVALLAGYNDGICHAKSRQRGAGAAGALNAGLPTDELIVMVRDLAQVLTKEGLAIRARVAETAADRLEQLSAARIN
ncbi:hypothetical protein [Sphingobium sp.]|uniref:hypothetical protein n=1 Tax=Sphingobium sp. TaxID=1912891 RepID=UPI0025EA7E7D|nr:hypothetical protein [Sphingobium sp.]